MDPPPKKKIFFWGGGASPPPKKFLFHIWGQGPPKTYLRCLPQKKIFFCRGGASPPPGGGHTQGWVPKFPMFTILGVYLYSFCMEISYVHLYWLLYRGSTIYNYSVSLGCESNFAQIYFIVGNQGPTL